MGFPAVPFQSWKAFTRGAGAKECWQCQVAEHSPHCSILVHKLSPGSELNKGP